MTMAPTLRLRLPATSANLGPGFDALGLALELFLGVDATPADAFLIEASGRNTAQVGSLGANLLIDTYRGLAPDGPALRLAIRNGIPLGMGCGSSAAALLAGVALANHFGGLGWTPWRVMEEACRLEGHPDNVAACALGGLTVSSMRANRVTAATLPCRAPWRLMLAMPGVSLATSQARALLPDHYLHADVVENLQAVALLVAAFAQNRGDLLQEATRDRVHQPYRMQACPLLAQLLPLQGQAGILSVTLSGAGPSVLLILDNTCDSAQTEILVRTAAADPALEVVMTNICNRAAKLS